MCIILYIYVNILKYFSRDQRENLACPTVQPLFKSLLLFALSDDSLAKLEYELFWVKY